MDLVDHSLLEVKLKGPVKPMIQPVSLGELVRAVIDDSVEDAAEKDVRLMRHDPEAITLGADPRLLRSALSNLLRNAVKFTHAGGSVVVRVHQSGQGRVAIEVEDECGGLPDGTVEKTLFDPFVQVGADRTGFGLGLAITRQAAEAHGGSVRVHSIPMRGCVFTIDLPR